MEETSTTLRLSFEVPLNIKIDFFRNGLNDYVATRREHRPLTELYRYFERQKATCSLTNKSSYSLLPVAVCRYMPANTDLIAPSQPDSCIFLPLIAEEVWSHLVTHYPYDIVKIIIDKRPTVDLSVPLSLSSSHKELKALDITYYFPRKFNRSSLLELSETIFNEDTYIKESLRRGVWMHLLQVFPPSLTTQQERSEYILKLRRIYSTLKTKLFSQRDSWSHELIHLRDSIRRDAIRTDPTESFLTEESNIELLIDIIMMYTLEHKSNVKYTQGMTDLLSPILYVMENEADAYICFAAMFERLKDNFTEWCEGALNRVERLRHLCEVLDPALFHHLCREEMEDPFILFFGMLLIECRREFNFNESLHLLEVMWSVALPKDTPTNIAENEWACYMTTESVGVVRESFGILSYSARPLSISETYPSILTHSLPRDIPSSSSSPSYHEEEVRSPHSSTSGRDRSVSLPEVAATGFVLIHSPNNNNETPILATKSEGHLPTREEEEEVRDSLPDLESSAKMSRRVHGLPSTNEMSDLSSLSSANTNGSNGVLSSVMSKHSKKREDEIVAEITTEDPLAPLSEATLTEVRSNPELVERSQELQSSARPRARSLRESDHSGGRVSPSYYYKHMSTPVTSSPYVSGIRPFECISLIHSEASSPYRSRTNSRVSPIITIGGEREASEEVSHVLSQLATNELARPTINRLTSLNVNMSETFSLFICLAILITRRDIIMKREVDFVGLSMILNSETGPKSDLTHILKVSRQLYNNYCYYQSISCVDTWIDDLPSFSMTNPTTPMDTPSSIRRYRAGSTGTNTSINI